MPEQERVFNSFRRLPFRPFYSAREFRAGLIVLLLLCAITAWVAWRGLHPDPDLFIVEENLLTAKGADIPVYERPVERWIEPGATAPATGNANPLEPFPSTMISEGWKATAPVQFFDESNLYSKIDGRETFYKSYGFKKLHFLSLESTTQKGLTIDVELFDLGSIENALGALNAEVSNPETKLNMGSAGLSYSTANGGFVSQGRYYARVIGSEDHPLIRSKIREAMKDLTAQLPGDRLPWTYSLFVGELGTTPGQIRYQPENAFSFSFATELYSAVIPGSTETEVFLSKRKSAEEAGRLAKQFAEGFSSYGKVLRQSPALIQNEFIQTVEGVDSYQTYVIGIRFAKNPEEAVQWIEKMKTALKKMGAV